ncbi:MAG: hypothetical protein KFF73_13780 [Cyclobacteriaceae bacterium]|nr:hypothetical protein [Cyclobacteriaceae bacterium]
MSERCGSYRKTGRREVRNPPPSLHPCLSAVTWQLWQAGQLQGRSRESREMYYSSHMFTGCPLFFGRGPSCNGDLFLLNKYRIFGAGLIQRPARREGGTNEFFFRISTTGAEVRYG